MISQIVYTYNHFREIKFDLDSNPERADYLEKQKGWIGIVLLGYVIALIILALFTNIKTFILSFTIVVSGILYTDYFKSLIQKYVTGAKTLYVSFFWAILVYFIPFFYNIRDILPYTYICMFVFLRFIVSTAFFDIKDIVDDKKRGLKTLAVLLGKKKTIYLLQILNILSFVPLIVGVYFDKLPILSLFLGISIPYGLFYLTYSLFLSRKSLRTLSYIVVDAEYIFWLIFILLGKIIL